MAEVMVAGVDMEDGAKDMVDGDVDGAKDTVDGVEVGAMVEVMVGMVKQYCLLLLYYKREFGEFQKTNISLNNTSTL